MAWRDLADLAAGADFAARVACDPDRGGRDLLAAREAWRAAILAAGARRVALHFADTFEFAGALLGAWAAGATAVIAGDATEITTANLAPHADAFAGDFPASAAPRIRPMAAGSAPAAAPRTRAEAPAPFPATPVVLFTSGTTGAPAAVAKSAADLGNELRSLEAVFGAGLKGARALATVSHQHIYGLLFRCLWPLAAGRPFACRTLRFPEELEEALAAPGPAAVIASPAFLKRLPAGPAWPEAPAALFSSGGPLPWEAAAIAAGLSGAAPLEVYGSTETGGIAWRRWDTDMPPWQPLPGVQWRIEEDCLAVASAHLESADWWRTQDRVEALADGHFRLLGRADRIVKIEEKRVSLAAVEQALKASGQVLEARALLLPGSRQELGVVLVPTAEAWAAIDQQGRSAWLAPLRDRLAAQLEATVRPRRWRLISELPANTQGKTTQAALQALFDPMRPPARVLQRDPLTARLRLDIEARHPGFEGHFDNQPVLPGVVQLDWAERLARELFALQPAFVGLDQLKFQQVIRPGSSVDIELTVNADGSELRFALSSERGAHASGKLRFGAGA